MPAASLRGLHTCIHVQAAQATTTHGFIMAQHSCSQSRKNANSRDSAEVNIKAICQPRFCSAWTHKSSLKSQCQSDLDPYMIHHLLPPPCDPALLSRLRAPSKFLRIPNRYKYQTFISYGLSNYQNNHVQLLLLFYYCNI